MSVPPTPEGSQEQRPGPGYTPATTLDMARVPIPGNAEFAVYLVAVILVAIIALASDRVDGNGFVNALIWMTAAYLISRGIAKASRVLEH